RLQIFFRREVLLRPRPRRDGVDDAADQLPDAALAFGTPDLPAEIFRDDDVGRLLRPGLRDLDVALLEDDLALFVADDGGAELPLHLIEGVDGGFRKEPGERQSRGGRGFRSGAWRFRRGRDGHVRARTAVDRLLHGPSRLNGTFLHLVSDRKYSVLPAPG